MFAKWKKSVRKDYILYDPITWLLEKANYEECKKGQWLPGI
jgi:hypothetical protein